MQTTSSLPYIFPVDNCPTLDCGFDLCGERTVRDYDVGSRTEQLIFQAGTIWRYQFATPEVVDTFFAEIANAQPGQVLEIDGDGYTITFLQEAVVSVAPNISFDFDVAINDASACSDILTNSGNVAPINVTPSPQELAAVTVCELIDQGEIVPVLSVRQVCDDTLPILENILEEVTDPVETANVWIADTVGDGTGTKNAVGDYSVTPEIFRVTAPIGGTLRVYRVIVQIADVGAPDSGQYGNNITLTNGITVGIYDSGGTLQVDLTDGEEIYTNGHWGRYSYDVSVSQFGSGDNYVDVRWSFDRFGGPIVLNDGEYVGIRLNDDFSGLVEHYFTFQGSGVR